MKNVHSKPVSIRVPDSSCQVASFDTLIRVIANPDGKRPDDAGEAWNGGKKGFKGRGKLGSVPGFFRSDKRSVKIDRDSFNFLHRKAAPLTGDRACIQCQVGAIQEQEREDETPQEPGRGVGFVQFHSVR